jgi:hypothetical protein
MEGAVKLDTLGLTVGNTYQFKMFFCERNMPGSSFRMVTSINLQTSSNIFANIRDSAGIRVYDLKEKITQTGLACDPGQTIVDTIPAIMDYILTGPQFATSPYQLTIVNSPHFGGITIRGDSTVVLDSTAIIGLVPGTYVIHCYLRSDHTQIYTIQFTVNKRPAHHLDLLVDGGPFDPGKDAQVDSIVIGMIETNASAYAVVRDSNQLYLENATSALWTVRNPAVATVEKVAGTHRCSITKVSAGQTWLVVTQGSLKPDSTLVITHVLPLYPVIVSGVMRDNDADLVPDLLSLTLSDTFKVDQRLDSVQIAYKGQVLTIPGASVTIAGKQLSVPVPPSVGVDGRPTGTATIFMTIDGDTQSHAQAFTDGVSPAIIAADVLENDGANPDVLFLTFSEPLTTGSVVGRQLLLIPQGTTDTVALTITQILGQSNDSLFTVQTASSDRKAIAGDRLRLVPGSAGGTLTDQKANKAHDLNRSVVIGFRPGAASIAGAWYLDMNADGILDQVVVQFKRKVEPSEVDYARLYRDPKQFTVAFVRATRLDESTYRIPIGDTLAQLNQIDTRGAMDLTIVYKTLPDIPRVSRVSDSAAPVIKSARLLPGALTASGIRGQDTLDVVFSEGVVQPGQMPFLLSARSGGLSYAFKLTSVGLTGSPYTNRFLVDSITNPSVLYAMAGDTIWINPTAGVSDSLSNTQSNPMNRRVLLEVTWPRANWNILLWNNPFTVGDVIREPFGNGSEYGTAILAQPTTPVDLGQVTSRIIIYDAVGNVLLSSAFEQYRGSLRFRWNGENKKGRFVGTGAYLSLIKITDAGGRVFTATKRIGVRKK